MLLCLNCLMQSVRVTSSRHNTSGKLIDDHNLIILNHVILITEHQIMCAKCKDDIMLDLKVIRIRKVLNMEELLNLMHTFLCQVDHFIFLIYDEISGLFLLDSHDSIHLGIFRNVLTSFHLLRKNIASLIQLCGLSTLSGNDKRSSRLIDQYGIDLINDRIMQISLYELLLVDYHVITQIIKTELIICYISDITIVCLTTLVIVHIIQNNSNRQSKEFMYFTHPLGISLRQVVIDRYDTDTLALQSVQICRKCGYQCLTFTGLHLCDTSLMQDNTTNDLYSVMFHTKDTACGLADCCKSLRKKIIKCLSLVQSFLIFFCFRFQLIVGKSYHLITIRFYFIDDRINAL